MDQMIDCDWTTLHDLAPSLDLAIHCFTLSSLVHLNESHYKLVRNADPWWTYDLIQLPTPLDHEPCQST